MLKYAGLLAVSAIIATAAHAQQDKNVKVVNGTAEAIVEFYASHKRATGWGRDLLGSDTIPARDDQTFNIDDGTANCLYDLKAVFGNKKEAETYSFNVCSRSEWRPRP